MKNILKSRLLFFILGIIVCSTTTYALSIASKDVSYDNTNSNSISDNVQGAVDELYSKYTGVYNKAYNEGYSVGYNKGVSDTKKGNASAGDVLSGRTFTNASGVNISGTMGNYSSPTYRTGVTLTSGDGRTVIVVRRSSGDSRVWRVTNSDGVYRTCIGVPYTGFYNTSTTLCTQD